MILLMWFGLLSVFAYASSVFCYNFPMTLSGDAWYAVHVYVLAAALLGVAMVAYRIACAGQPLQSDDLSPA